MVFLLMDMHNGVLLNFLDIRLMDGIIPEIVTRRVGSQSFVFVSDGAGLWRATRDVDTILREGGDESIISELLQKICEGMKKEVGCGLKSWAFLTDKLLSISMNLVRSGYNRSDIIRGLILLCKICRNAVSVLTVPVSMVQNCNKVDHEENRDDTEQDVMWFLSDDNGEDKVERCEDGMWRRGIFGIMSTGEDKFISRLAEEAFVAVDKDIEKCNSKNIIVRGVCGLPRDSSSVYRGFVVPITLHQKHLWSDVVELRDSDGKRVISWGRVLVVNRVANGNTVSKGEINDFLKFVKTENVRVIFVQDKVDRNIMGDLSQCGVYLLDEVTSSELARIQNCTSSNIVPTFVDACAEFLGEFEEIEAVQIGWKREEDKEILEQTRRNHAGVRSESYLWIKTLLSEMVVVVMCDPIYCILQHLEDEFWRCLSRLRNAEQAGNVMIGGGIWELSCSCMINNYDSEISPVEKSVLLSFQEAFDILPIVCLLSRGSYAEDAIRIVTRKKRHLDNIISGLIKGESMVHLMMKSTHSFENVIESIYNDFVPIREEPQDSVETTDFRETLYWEDPFSRAAAVIRAVGM